MTATRGMTSLMLFSGAIAVVYAVAFLLTGRLGQLERPGIVAAGVTLDLVLTVPALWYFLVVRRNRWPWISVAPVVLLSVLAATQIMPETHRGTLRVIEYLLVPLELGLLAFIAWSAVRAARRFRARASGGGDALDAIREAALEAIHVPRVAEIAATEIAVFHYGLASWWGKGAARGPHEFTSHEKSTYGSVIVGLLMVTAIELFPVHLLLSRWSPLAAWLLTALSVYGVLWLLADYRASRLRPISLTGTALHLPAGLRWDVVIPIEAVRSIERAGSSDDAEPKPLAIAAFSDATFELRTHERVAARGLYGLLRHTDRITFTVDEPDRFLAAWRERTPEAEDSVPGD